MVKNEKFETLLDSYRLKHLTLKNRIVKAPYSSTGADAEGYVLDSGVMHYDSVARGGVGLFITESVAVDPLGVSGSPRMALWDDSFIPGQKRLVEAVHKYGTPVLAQIHHAGTAHSIGVYGAQVEQEVAPVTPVGPSTLSREELPAARSNLPRGLTIPGIKELVGKFVRAAERARDAGYDGVQLHCAFAYLLASFFSPAWNRRTDAYGGSVENRARFAVEILQGIRESLGDDFIVGIRMNAREYMTNQYMTSQGMSSQGLTYEDSRQIAKLLEESGADFIHVSAFGNGIKWEWAHFPEQVLFPDVPEGAEDFKRGVLRGEALIPGAEYFKKALSIPIIGGDSMTFESAERVLRQGRADLISFARPLIADPDFPTKLREDRVKDIRPCTRCMTCLDAFIRSEHEKCRVNAAFAKEQEMKITPAPVKKRVLVVGGGPAGMEAARVAALRGHQVTLVERQSRLGGLMPLASLIKGTEVEDIPAFVTYLSGQMNRLGIEVRKGQNVDTALVRELRPDVALVATGSRLTVPDIPGINGKTVTTSSDLHKKVKLPLRFFSPAFLNWATRLWLPVGKRVVLIGGLMQGAEVAEFLVKRGRQVVLTDTSRQLGLGMLEINRTRLLKWLTEKGARLLAGVTYEKITDKGVTLTTGEGERMTIPADTVMVVSVPEADHTLYQELKTSVPEVYEIGDCHTPGMIVDAVEAGARAALTL